MDRVVSRFSKKFSAQKFIRIFIPRDINYMA